jgi:chitin synthase
MVDARRKKSSKLYIPILADTFASQIVGLSIVAPFLAAALLESFLWVASFCYCFAKAYQKADHWSQKVLTIIMVILFIALR